MTASYPSWSPYPFAMNRVIDGIDLDGLEWQPVNPAGENVAVDSDEISDYNFVGFVDGYQTADGTSYVNLSDIPNWSVRSDISEARVGPTGTVRHAQLPETFLGRTFEHSWVTVYTVTPGTELPLTYKQKRTPWLATAFDAATQFGGVSEDNDFFLADNPVTYLNYEGVPANMRSRSESTPWCAAFANFCLEENGFLGQADNPLSVYNWNGTWNSWAGGYQIDEPAYGALVTMSRSGGGHTGFLVGMIGTTHVLLMGGNQNDAVNVTAYRIRDSFEYFLPNGYASTPLDRDRDFLQNSYDGEYRGGGSTR